MRVSFAGTGLNQVNETERDREFVRRLWACVAAIVLPVIAYLLLRGNIFSGWQIEEHRIALGLWGILIGVFATRLHWFTRSKF
jgi:hypothetical protein